MIGLNGVAHDVAWPRSFQLADMRPASWAFNWRELPWRVSGYSSPWALKFSGTRPAPWNALIVGALVIIFAAWDLGAMQQASARRA